VRAHSDLGFRHIRDLIARVSEAAWPPLEALPRRRNRRSNGCRLTGDRLCNSPLVSSHVWPGRSPQGTRQGDCALCRSARPPGGRLRAYAVRGRVNLYPSLITTSAPRSRVRARRCVLGSRGGRRQAEWRGIWLVQPHFRVRLAPQPYAKPRCRACLHDPGFSLGSNSVSQQIALT
jgi:hypothetical protein